ncbi:kinase inhibitor [Serratia marcescens]|uniref:kinase inhibitor n=1 Tax=Serratia marcescens TaxID=615 RepID=UPI002DB57F43|nr:kinase inhibitor [Serratia marcescens]MEB6080429.1 kinase inhibitor [Serratia marcescens]
MKKRTLLLPLLMVSSLAQAQTFRVTSTDIKTGQELAKPFIQNGSGCSGGDISPQLSWSGEPEGTKSFAVTAYDPDAPTGSGWWHWTLVNIPNTVHSLKTDAGNRNSKNVPTGAVQGRTDFGNPGYGGACPPEGDKSHHYHFKVWALKVDKLPVTNESSGALVGYMVNANKLAVAELVPVSTR